MSVPARHLRTPEPERRGDDEAPIRVVPRAEPGATTEARATLVVVPRHVRRRRAGLAIAVGVMAVFGLMLGLVAFQAKIAQNQLQLDRADRDLQQAEASYAQLRLQVASLEAPDRIVAEAKQLGLVRPGPADVHYLTAPPAVVGAVVAASGGPEDTGPAGTADAQDWSNLKPLLRGAP